MSALKTCGVSTGVLELQLARPQPGAIPTIPVPADIGQAPPSFDGSVEEFILTHTAACGEDALRAQLLNKVKKCERCGKPNAFTLSECNSCGADLRAVAVSHTNNVFTGFIYGIARGPFPFKISMRHQSPELMVFDDLLALTPCHLNCIPTGVHLPDLRVLFTRPREAEALLQRMYDAEWRVAREQFLGNESWRAKVWRNGESVDIAAAERHVIVGLNFPPSQYQLHLQFMLPPLMPFHWGMYRAGKHFTPRRFFPLEYMRKALGALDDDGIPDAASMDIEDLIALIYSRHGINYDQMHRECYDRYGASHTAVCAWDPSDFGGYLVDGKFIITEGEQGALVEDSTSGVVAKLQGQDKVVLQNYGRPYDADGRPTGTFYKYAQKPPLPTWG